MDEGGNMAVVPVDKYYVVIAMGQEPLHIYVHAFITFRVVIIPGQQKTTTDIDGFSTPSKLPSKMKNRF